jgi:hypothetical protein
MSINQNVISWSLVAQTHIRVAVVWKSVRGKLRKISWDKSRDGNLKKLKLRIKLLKYVKIFKK